MDSMNDEVTGQSIQVSILRIHLLPFTVDTQVYVIRHSHLDFGTIGEIINVTNSPTHNVPLYEIRIGMTGGCIFIESSHLHPFTDHPFTDDANDFNEALSSSYAAMTIDPPFYSAYYLKQIIRVQTLHEARRLQECQLVPVESLVVSLNSTQLQLAKKVQKSEAERARRLKVKTCIENIPVVFVPKFRPIAELQSLAQQFKVSWMRLSEPISTWTTLGNRRRSVSNTIKSTVRGGTSSRARDY